MSTTPHLGLSLLESSEWSQTYFRDYINALSANNDASNMMLIDAAYWKLQQAMTGCQPQAKKITLQLSSWDDEHRQLVESPDISEDESAQLLIALPTIESREIYGNCGVDMIDQQAGAVVFSCNIVPEADVDVWLVIVNVK